MARVNEWYQSLVEAIGSIPLQKSHGKCMPSPILIPNPRRWRVIDDDVEPEKEPIQLDEG